jgi:signal transduction histidine kinase
MATPLRVLIVDDSEDDAELLVLELKRRGFAPSAGRVETAAALNAALSTGRWEIVLSDYNMPGFTGSEALAIVKAHAPDVPFILVSGSIGEEHAVEAMRAGASDFVGKSNLHRLAPVVERELREAQHRVEQRTMSEALVESRNQFRHVQKLEAVGRLAGGIAHDFNNLLTAILGYADLLLSDLPADDRHRADVEEIRRAGARAADLTRQLLAFSRQQVLDLAVVSLNDVITDTQRLLSRVIGEDVVLERRCEEALWYVKADRTQVVQILMNLAVNARDAMPQGGTLTMTTANVLVEAQGRHNPLVRPGPYAVVEVRDTGEGIPPDVLPRIFEPFFTTKDAGKGTGLGLSTVYGIVKQSEGFIFVDSTPGKGTVFTIYFPQTLERLVQDARPEVSEGPDGHETILVVDDEPSVRELTARVLRQAGYRVIVASGPEAACQALADHDGPLDLLLTDIVLPGGNGRTLAKQLVAARPGLRVLFMSGFTGDVSYLGGRPDGDLLVKPFSPAALESRVRGALQKTTA